MCNKCGKPNPSAYSAWCDFCRDEEAGFPAHTRERALRAAQDLRWGGPFPDLTEQVRRYSWRLRGHR